MKNFTVKFFDGLEWVVYNVEAMDIYKAENLAIRFFKEDYNDLSIVRIETTEKN